MVWAPPLLLHDSDIRRKDQVMTEAALYDEDLDLSPEVLCSLLRRRTAVAALARHAAREVEADQGDEASPSCYGRTRPLWL